MQRLAVVVILLVAATARAQAPDGAPGSAPPPPAPAPAAPAPAAPPAATPVAPGTTAAEVPVPTGDEGIRADANQDHAWYLPTGETVPKGDVVFTDWELLLAGLKYGAADNLEISAETLVPITSDIPLLILLGAKVRVIKTSNTRVALNANLLYTSENSDSFSLGAVGGVASLCLDASCHSLLSGGLQLMFGLNTRDSSGAFVFVPNASLIGRLGKHVKALVEVDGAGYHANGDTQLARGALLFYGFRFYSSEIAGDIGFARPVCSSGCDTGNLVLGAPLITFSYRG